MTFFLVVGFAPAPAFFLTIVVIVLLQLAAFVASCWSFTSSWVVRFVTLVGYFARFEVARVT